MAAQNVSLRQESRVVYLIGYVIDQTNGDVMDQGFDHVRKRIYQSTAGDRPWRVVWSNENYGREEVALHSGFITYDGRRCGIVIGMPTSSVSAMRASRLVGCLDDGAILITRATPERIAALGLHSTDPYAYAVIKGRAIPYTDLTNAVLLIGSGWYERTVPPQKIDALVREIIETFIFPPLDDDGRATESSRSEAALPTKTSVASEQLLPFFGSSDNPDGIDLTQGSVSDEGRLPLYG